MSHGAGVRLLDRGYPTTRSAIVRREEKADLLLGVVQPKGPALVAVGVPCRLSAEDAIFSEPKGGIRPP